MHEVKKGLAVLLSCFAVSISTIAQVRLPALVRDSMILQRDRQINIWGWASGGEMVTVKMNSKTVKTTTDNNGKWMLSLPAMKAGGPYTMQITGKNKIVLNNILIGDVWFCSGQSNMVHQMKLHSVRYANEIAEANYPQIRQFWIPNVAALQGARDTLSVSYWKSANSNDVLDFSAVAYFFAKDLYKKYGVPIGIINASVGGTPIEAWTSEEGLQAFPEILNIIQKNKDTAYINGIIKSNVLQAANLPKQEDKGLSAATPWYDTSYVAHGWKPLNVPGYWEDEGVKDLNGAIWYRKEIDVPASMISKPATVFLGRIVDADFLYINGKLIGNTTYLYPQRRYAVPSGLLKPGRNIITVRVVNYSGKGGFVPDKPYCLFAGNDTIDLKGNWHYKVGEVFAPQPATGSNFAAQNQPSSLYNAMVAPVIHYTIKGIAWYQGESNTGNPAEYAKLQPALITDWRSKWKEGDIPFLYVQLPGFGDYNYLPSESQWAELRQAQLQSLSVPNTAMAVAIDVGEWNDIHPDRKKEVGDRLALAAERITYGEKDVVGSPFYKSYTVDSNRIILSFSNVGSGLMTNDDDAPNEFSIAGADKKFVWANAKIEGDNVIVWSNEIQTPKYVRYAWADNPVNPNLYNKEGLPASPFEATVK